MTNSHSNNAQLNSESDNPDILAAIQAASAAAAADDAHALPADTSPQAKEKSGSEEPNPQAVKVQHEHAGEIDGEEYDAILNQSFEDREKRLLRRKKIQRICTLLLFLGITGSSYAWYSASPENQAKVHGLWGQTKSMAQDVKEGTDVGKIVEKYDAALEKIAVHGDKIDDASISLGMDPTEDDAESREQLAKQMKTITGDARTTMDRDAEMQKRFAKFAKEQRAKIAAERAKKKAEEEKKASR